MPGSAISAVATGTHTPHVTRSTSILVCGTIFPSSSLLSQSMAIISLANMPSLTLKIVPYIPLTVFAISSNRKNNPAHSPRDPPSSNFPLDSLDRMIGIMATRAKALSASCPFPSNARPRKQCPIINMRSCDRCPLSCLVNLFSLSLLLSESSIKCRTFVSRLSNLPTKHLAVSLSSRRIRGESFIKKRDFSMITPLIPLVMEDVSFREGSMLVESLSASFPDLAGVAPPMVMAETSA